MKTAMARVLKVNMKDSRHREIEINVPIKGKLSRRELDRSLAMSAEVLRKCPVHKRYRGKSRPANECPGCWRYYLDGNRWEAK